MICNWKERLAEPFRPFLSPALPFLPRRVCLLLLYPHTLQRYASSVSWTTDGLMEQKRGLCVYPSRSQNEKKFPNVPILCPGEARQRRPPAERSGICVSECTNAAAGGRTWPLASARFAYDG